MKVGGGAGMPPQALQMPGILPGMFPQGTENLNIQPHLQAGQQAKPETLIDLGMFDFK